MSSQLPQPSSPHLSTQQPYPSQPQRQQPVQEDFYLLDVVGGSQVVALHPTKPIVAYNAGCMIIIYDLMTDSKINLIHHQHEVQALAFSPPGSANSVSGGDFLISIDFDKNDQQSNAFCGTMCLWNWPRGACIQEVQIPKSQNISVLQGIGSNQRSDGGSDQSKMIQRIIKIYFDKVGGLFYVLESSPLDYGGGYRVSIWNLGRYQRLELVSQLELELQSSACGLAILSKSIGSTSSQQTMYGTQSRNPSLKSLNTQQPIQSSSINRFLTLEKNCIKFWDYQQQVNNAELLKKIHIKQNMKQILVSDLTGFLFILGENGKVLILDHEGEFVSTIVKESQIYSSMGITQDKLLLGTERGTVQVFHLASLQFINEVPYQLSILSNFNLNNTKLQSDSPKKSQDQDDLSIFKIGPPIEHIALTYNMRFLFIKYADQSFVVLDRTAGDPKKAVIGYQYGHFEKVQSLQWMAKSNKKNGGKSLASYSGETWSNLHSSNDCFVTCSSDMSIFIWKHFGDRWSFSYIDVVKCFEQSLSFQRKQSDRSIQNLRLTSLYVYPKQPFLICGDNKGVVRIFQVSQDQALFVASHKLMKLIEDQSEDPIVDIHITQDESFAIVAFQSGLICVYDAQNTFNLLGIVEKDAQRFTYSNQLEIQFKVLEYPSQSDVSFTTTSKYRQDERPFLNTSLDTEYASMNINRGINHTFRILATQSPNCIRLQSIEIRGNKLVKTPLVQFMIDEGRVQGFDVHPSGDYLLVTSNKGRIYVYRIDTGELRGTIQIPLHSKGCCIDPSGLYVLVQAPPFDIKHTLNLVDEQTKHNYLDESYHQQQIGQIGTNEADLSRTTLLMFEIGTGLAAAEIKGIFEIEQMKFSQDGRYLSLGSRQGGVCVWAIGEHLYSNIKQVLDALVLQPDFWSNYPIFLNDYGIYGMTETPDALSSAPLQYDQPIFPQEEVLDIYDSEPLHYSERPKQQSQPQMFKELPKKQEENPNQRYQTDLYQKQPSIISSGRQNQKGVQANRNVVTGKSQEIQTLPEREQIKVPQVIKHDVQKPQINQDRFIRKTYVEDQFTQITPQPTIDNINQGSFNKDLPQLSNRSVQIQTSNQEETNETLRQQQRRNQGVRQPQTFNYKQEQSYQNQQSNYSSPNKAELLYTNIPFNQNNSNQKSPPQIYDYRYNESLDPNIRKTGQVPQMSLQKNAQIGSDIPYREIIPGGGGIVRESRTDFIDRPVENLRMQQPEQYVNRNQIIEDRREEYFRSHPQPNYQNSYQQYEQQPDTPQLYNPFTGNIESKTIAAQYDTKASGIPLNPINSGQPYQNPTGRLQGSNQKPRQITNDPKDIDDDISDHGPDSLEYQLRDLDVKSKYLQNIRVPTRFAGDDFMSLYGPEGGEKAYTLARMRQEEQWLEGDKGFYRDEGEPKFEGEEGRIRHRKGSDSSSTMNIVEEMYENMNEFDQKLKVIGGNGKRMMVLESSLR